MTLPSNMLTRGEVLAAVRDAGMPYTIAIADIIFRRCRAQDRHINHYLIRKRLNELAEEGVLTRSGEPRGYYGYRWEIPTSTLQEGE